MPIDEGGTGHYPQQVAFDAYGKGGFRFAGLSHRGSILALPTGMHAWPVTSVAELSIESLRPALDLADRIDVLLIGTGHDIVFLDPQLRARFRERGIILEAIATGGAVRTYNVLLAEDRSVAAALIAVERAS